jgi:tetratricopeptide (TPR) repeat protein
VQAVCAAPILLAPLLGGTAARPYTLLIAGLSGAAALSAAALRPSHARKHDHSRRGAKESSASPTPPASAEGAHDSGRHDTDAATKVSWFAALLALATLAAVFQTIPLPAPLRALLAPGTDATLRHVLSGLDPAGYPAGGYPISVDPSATANEAIRLGGYLCLLLGLGLAFSHRGDGTRLLRIVYVSAGLVAFCGLLAALGFPLPAPIAVPGIGTTRARLPAAFYNSNHMAAMLSIGAILALGDACLRPWRQRVPLLSLLILLNAALLGTLSRGGIVMGLAGQGAVLALHAYLRPPDLDLEPSRARRAARRRLRLLLLGAFAALLVLSWVFFQEAREALLSRFGATRLSAELSTPGSKIQAWVQAMPLLYGHWLLGVGRGAFENAFQGVNSLAGNTRFIYLENEWLQLVVDFGIPTALLFLALCGLGVWDGVRRVLRERERGDLPMMRIAALCALCAVALHNLVDFNLETGGVAVAVVALCSPSVIGQARLRVPRLRLLVIGAGALAIAGAMLGVRWTSHTQDGEQLLAMAADPAVPTEQVIRRGTQAVRRHPLDSYLSATVAARLWQDGRPEAVAWLNRALVANPRDVDAARVSALLLAARGYRGQAALTLRHALQQSHYEQRQKLYGTALRVARTEAEFLETLPPSTGIAGEALEFLSTQETPRWPLVRAVGAWAEGLKTPRVALWMAQAALAERDLDEATRWGGRLLAEEEAARRSAGARAEAPPALLLSSIAGLLQSEGRLEAAESLCRRALALGPAVEVQLALSRVREARGDLGEARALLEAALAGAADVGQRVMLHEERALLEERLGNMHRAALERREAERLKAERAGSDANPSPAP